MKFFYYALILSIFTSTAHARETLGVFGEWGAFKQRGACYATSTPAQPTSSKRSEPYITVSIFPLQGQTPQVMVATGTIARSVSVRAGGQSFRPTLRGDAAWMPDSRGDALMVQAFSAASNASVDITTARVNRITDHYSLSGFGEALKAVQAACR